MNLIDQLEKAHIDEIASSMVKDQEAEGAAEKIAALQDSIRGRRKKFNIGDYVKVFVKIVEGKRERIQVFEGYVISFKGHGITRTFTVRKISFGVGVERTFPFYSPKIDRIELIRKGRIRRAKLYYLRKRRGKKAAIKERINFKK
ncbi:MAG: 50S ribosomal protein L19 [Spirochaetes bacterium]|nr:50S ribosomal protein L19 [Spirochaetota bacterium]